MYEVYFRIASNLNFFCVRNVSLYNTEQIGGVSHEKIA